MRTLRRMFGRQVIYSSADEITEANIIEEIRRAYEKHSRNYSDIEYLFKYYKGDQSILYRQKEIRPEINNKIVENHAYEIVEFKTGYVFGEPIQYVKRSEEGTADEVTALNKLMAVVDKANVDREIGESQNICGTAYRGVFPDEENKIEIMSLDPRFTFVVYRSDIFKTPLMGVHYTLDDDRTPTFYIYTKNRSIVVKNRQILSNKPHALKNIPIIEYPANTSRLGAFEVVLGLLEAINNTQSDRVNAIEQFVQAFVKFINCDIDEYTFKEMLQLGAIKVKSVDGVNADVDIVSQELNQAYVQMTKDDLYQTMLIICGMPDRKATSSGDTGQAVMLRDGWSSAEARAKQAELIFKKSERKFLTIALRILNNRGLNVSLDMLDIKFTRNKTDNLIVKTQGLQNQLEAGVHPRIALANVGLYSDAEQVYEESKEYLEKWKVSQATNGQNQKASDNEEDLIDNNPQGENL